jgi:hypothetical protein
MTATVSPLTTATPETPEEALSLADYVPYRLVTAAAAVSRLIARAYEDRFGLTIPQWRLMSVRADPARRCDPHGHGQGPGQSRGSGPC